MERMPPHLFQRVARVAYGVACVAVLVWTVRFVGSMGAFSAGPWLIAWLVLYTGGLALAVARLRPHAEMKHEFPLLLFFVLLHALVGAVACVDLALHGPGVAAWSLILAAFATFSGCVPALILLASARHAGPFAMVSLSGTGLFLAIILTG